MADQDRAAADSLIHALQTEPYRFGFFPLLRSIECRNPSKPRLGTSARAAQDPIRLGQEPHLEFAPATIASCEPSTASGVPFVAVRFLGLFGPQGPLPLHLTEYARERMRNVGDQTFARFADIFHHRMLCLFYRAWANSQPAVSYDRPETDRFALYVGSLFGLAGGELRHRDALPDLTKLFFAGHFAGQTRHADGLTAILHGYFSVPVRIQEFIGEWMNIAESDQTRLGVSPATGRLGMSAVAGSRVWGCQHKFHVVLGPLTFAEYRSFLPGGTNLARLTAAVRNYIGVELVWSLRLVLRSDEVPMSRLDGGARLGWTTWGGERRTAAPADDLILDPYFHEARSGIGRREPHQPPAERGA